MSYVLTAVFGRRDIVDDLSHPSLGRPVMLGAGFAMRPTVDLDDPYADSFDPMDLDVIDDVLGPLLLDASEFGPLAYVHIEMFGGPADEAVAVWRDGELVWRAAGHELDERLSREAFRLIGVEAGPGVDEFDTLGLGRHRDTESWLEEP